MGNYSKFIIAVLAAAISWVTLVVNSPEHAISSVEWALLLTNVAGAVGVVVVPNARKSDG